MKKIKIVGIVLTSLILIGLIVFASTHEFEDSHLRVEGIRVKVGEYALLVDECDKETETVAYCKKVLEVDGEKQTLEFKFINFKPYLILGVISFTLFNTFSACCFVNLVGNG